MLPIILWYILTQRGNGMRIRDGTSPGHGLTSLPMVEAVPGVVVETLEVHRGVVPQHQLKQ
ncbi:MAG TPA: hypothetical protein DDY49_12565 [Paenibacillaceae bacterium]|nr:hypothetical protein [Paenibacillaceae bacterium]